MKKLQKKHLKFWLFFTVFILIVSLGFTLPSLYKQNSSLTHCTGNPYQKKECWNSLAKQTVKQKGINAAFAQIKELMKSDPAFPSYCHEFAHAIGHSATPLIMTSYNNKTTISIGADISSCGNGFIHAITPAVTDEKSFTKARNFCLALSELIIPSPPDFLQQCYHGVGHSIIIPITRIQDLEDAILQVNELCKPLTEEGYRCTSGAYDNIFQNNIVRTYYMSHTDEDPYSLCQILDTNQDGCIGAIINGMILPTLKSDTKLVDLLQNTQRFSDDKNASAFVAGFVQTFARKDSLLTYSELITTCKTLRPQLLDRCIGSFITGRMESSIPGDEYHEMLNFCKNSLFTKEEKNICYQQLLDISRKFYSPHLTKQLCKNIKENYSVKCDAAIP